MSNTCVHCSTTLLNISTAFERAGFCCRGCEQVHAFLSQENLSQYYEILKETNAISRSPVREETLQGFDPVEKHARKLQKMHQSANGEFCFVVPGLSCVACLWAVEKAILRIKEVRSCRANLFSRTVIVTLNSSDLQQNEFQALVPVYNTLAHLGLEHTAPSFNSSREELPAFQRKLLRDVGLAGVLFGNVMLFTTGLYFGEKGGMSPALSHLFVLISGTMATLSLAFPGRSFFQNALRSLRSRSLLIDLPIAFALLVAFGMSLWNLFQKNIWGTYFDSISGLIFLLLSARLINETLVRRAQQVSASRHSLLPDWASHLEVGDEVQISVGQVFPADGALIAGATEVSEAAVTGESRLVLKRQDDRVIGGTHNLGSLVRMKVEKNAQQSYLAQVEKLIQTALDQKPRSLERVQRILPWFVGGAFIVATAVFLYWGFIAPQGVHELNVALARALAVLIVSCPCAIALAAPLVYANGLHETWRRGIVVKSCPSFEALASVNTIVSDKTGTLTCGSPKVLRATFMKPKVPSDVVQKEFFAQIYAATSQSRHPVAKVVFSFCSAYSGCEVVDKSREIVGCGLVASFFAQSHLLYIGQPRWMAEVLGYELIGLPSECSVVIAAQGDVLCYFELEDAPRSDASSTVEAWTKKGYSVLIASGDSNSAVQKLGLAFGLPASSCHSEMLPDDKLRLLQTLQNNPERKVLMLGDGINDAPCLAKADVGIAVRGSVDMASASADVFFSNDYLCNVASLIDYSRYLKVSLEMALCASIAYNAIAVVFAATGHIHPLVAALIMPLSSITTLAIATFRKGNSTWKSCSYKFHLP